MQISTSLAVRKANSQLTTSRCLALAMFFSPFVASEKLRKECQNEHIEHAQI